jgi:eukaryotic-like serine/threonine-protein kinase
MISPLVGRSSNVRPFMLDPGPEAAKALWNGMAEFQLAWPLAPVDIGDLHEFIDRWASWFADASEGRLGPPSTMPERSTPRDWR